MKIDHQLAQEIVKRAMKIVPYSVNVMNEQGYIIASGDLSRIGERHTGAVIALRESHIVEIDSDLVKAWNYEVRTGVNLPIRFQEKNIGVIGISGDLIKVRHYAELVKMAAEMIIEQRVMIERHQWQRRYFEDFLVQLLKDDLPKDEILNQAQFFQFNLECSLQVMIIALADPCIDHTQTWLSYLEKYYQQRNLIVGRNKQIIVLWQDDIPVNFEKTMPLALKKIKHKIALGLRVSTGYQAAIAYKSAINTLDFGKYCFPKKHCYRIDEYKIPTLLYNLQSTWYVTELLKPIESLHKADKNGLLHKTLMQYFFSNCDLVHTSKKLFIHINTLRYRLSKIETITGLSFNRIDEKFILYLSTILWQ